MMHTRYAILLFLFTSCILLLDTLTLAFQVTSSRRLAAPGGIITRYHPVRCNTHPGGLSSDEDEVTWDSEGGYSWTNQRAIQKEVIRPNRDGVSSTSSDKRTPKKDHYKRIHFDGCGSILLHQIPEAFIEPNSPKSESNNTDESDGEHDNQSHSINTLGSSSTRSRHQGRTGVTLWSAAYTMSYYIDNQWTKGGRWNPQSSANDCASKWTVLELGAGLGLPSAVSAKHGMNVIATDSDDQVLMLLKENLQRNQKVDDHASELKQQQIEVHSLDWKAVANDDQAEANHPVFSHIYSLGGADLILLSDLVYGATQPAWGALLVLLNKFRDQRQRLYSDTNAENGPIVTDRIRCDGTNTPTGNPLVLLGYTQRRRDMSPQDEANFFAMLQAAKMEAVLVPLTDIPNGEKYMLTTLFELRWTSNHDLNEAHT